MHCWHAKPMGKGGVAASTRSSALATHARVRALAPSFVDDTQATRKNVIGRPLGLGGSTG
jgi:hypothetical protein